MFTTYLCIIQETLTVTTIILITPNYLPKAVCLTTVKQSIALTASDIILMWVCRYVIIIS